MDDSGQPGDAPGGGGNPPPARDGDAWADRDRDSSSQSAWHRSRYANLLTPIVPASRQQRQHVNGSAEVHSASAPPYPYEGDLEDAGHSPIPTQTSGDQPASWPRAAAGGWGPPPSDEPLPEPPSPWAPGWAPAQSDPAPGTPDDVPGPFAAVFPPAPPRFNEPAPPPPVRFRPRHDPATEPTGDVRRPAPPPEGWATGDVRQPAPPPEGWATGDVRQPAPPPEGWATGDGHAVGHRPGDPDPSSGGFPPIGAVAAGASTENVPPSTPTEADPYPADAAAPPRRPGPDWAPEWPWSAAPPPAPTSPVPSGRIPVPAPRPTSPEQPADPSPPPAAARPVSGPGAAMPVRPVSGPGAAAPPAPVSASGAAPPPAVRPVGGPGAAMSSAVRPVSGPGAATPPAARPVSGPGAATSPAVRPVSGPGDPIPPALRPVSDPGAATPPVAADDGTLPNRRGFQTASQPPMRNTLPGYIRGGAAPSGDEGRFLTGGHPTLGGGHPGLQSVPPVQPDPRSEETDDGGGGRTASGSFPVIDRRSAGLTRSFPPNAPADQPATPSRLTRAFPGGGDPVAPQTTPLTGAFPGGGDRVAAVEPVAPTGADQPVDLPGRRAAMAAPPAAPPGGDASGRRAGPAAPDRAGGPAQGEAPAQPPLRLASRNDNPVNADGEQPRRDGARSGQPQASGGERPSGGFPQDRASRRVGPDFPGGGVEPDRGFADRAGGQVAPDHAGGRVGPDRASGGFGDRASGGVAPDGTNGGLAAERAKDGFAAEPGVNGFGTDGGRSGFGADGTRGGFAAERDRGGFAAEPGPNGFRPETGGGFATESVSDGFAPQGTGGGFGSERARGGSKADPAAGGFAPDGPGGGFAADGGFGQDRASGGFGQDRPSGGFGVERSVDGFATEGTGDGFGAGRSSGGFAAERTRGGFGEEPAASGFAPERGTGGSAAEGASGFAAGPANGGESTTGGFGAGGYGDEPPNRRGIDPPPVEARSVVDDMLDELSGLPQRVPAEPDVPTVPEPPSDTPADPPQLARIATHLRRPDLPAEQDRPDGFDVDAILAAVRGVAGVKGARLRTTPAGAHSLRLDLSDGADAADVSRHVARLLQERMGLAAAPQNLPGMMPAESPLGGDTPPTGFTRNGGYVPPPPVEPAPRPTDAATARPAPRPVDAAPGKPAQPPGFEPSPDPAQRPAASHRGRAQVGAQSGVDTRDLAGRAAPVSGPPQGAPPQGAPPQGAPPQGAEPAHRQGADDAERGHLYGGQREASRSRRVASDPPGQPVPGSFPDLGSAAGIIGSIGGHPVTAAATAYSGGQISTTESAPSRPLNPGANPGPRVVIDHVQVSTFGLDATVETRLAAGKRLANGLATGPAVDGYVLRLCAVSAAAAIDELLRTAPRDDDRGRCFVEHAAVVPFGNCEVAVVVVLLVCGGWVEQLAGSALVSGDPRQAVVRATLAAVNRRLEALLSD